MNEMEKLLDELYNEYVVNMKFEKREVTDELLEDILSTIKICINKRYPVRDDEDPLNFWEQFKGDLLS